MIRTKLCSSVIAISTLSVFLAGCGGSGSSGIETPVSGSTYTGVVVDGPLEGASVFADINRNGTKDAGEPATVTGKDGHYTLKVPSDIFQPPIIIEVPPTAIDADSGKPVGKYYRLGAPDGVYSVMNPITTMIKSLMDVNPGLKRTDAESIVRGYLNLSDTYEIYADYSIVARPDGVTKDKWDKFLSESGRARNIGRVTAAILGKYWENAQASYGGNIPKEKMGMIQALLTEAALKSVAPLAGALPNDGLVDIDTLTIPDPVLPYEKLEARMRQIVLGASTSLGKVIAEGALHAVPLKNVNSNYAHFTLRDGGSSNITGQSVIGESKIILPDLTETDEQSIRSLGDGDRPLFEGGLRFDATSGEDVLSDLLKAFRWRLVRLPTEGEYQRTMIDSSWLKDSVAVWPAKATAYRALVRVSGAGVVSYLKDSAQYQSGALPDALFVCCSAATGKAFRMGDLGVKFFPDVNGFGYGGVTQYESFATGTAVALPTKGSWGNRSTFSGLNFVSLAIPNEYWADLKETANDRLFSNFSRPSMVLAQIGVSKYTTGWLYPEGRYAEFVMLNDVAYNALKANLKW